MPTTSRQCFPECSDVNRQTILQAFLTPQYLAIAMEYASGGDMFEHVVRKGGLKENEARWFFQQLIVGVDYVHKMVRDGRTRLELRYPSHWSVVTVRGVLTSWRLQGVANRDIKLENTLLDGSPRPLVKICDFGYSKVCCRLRCTWCRYLGHWCRVAERGIVGCSTRSSSQRQAPGSAPQHTWPLK